MDKKKIRSRKCAAIVGVFLGVIVITAGMIYLKNHIDERNIWKEEERQRNERVAAEMEKFYAGIRRNDLKADSIIDSINDERREQGLPVYDIRIIARYQTDRRGRECDIMMTTDLDHFYFKKGESYGVCRYVDNDKILAEGLLFNLREPSEVLPIRVWRLIDEYKGDASPEIWGRFKVKIR